MASRVRWCLSSTPRLATVGSGLQAGLPRRGAAHERRGDVLASRGEGVQQPRHTVAGARQGKVDAAEAPGAGYGIICFC